MMVALKITMTNTTTEPHRIDGKLFILRILNAK